MSQYSEAITFNFIGTVNIFNSGVWVHVVAGQQRIEKAIHDRKDYQPREGRSLDRCERNRFVSLATSAFDPRSVVQIILQEHVDLPTITDVPLSEASQRLRILPSEPLPRTANYGGCAKKQRPRSGLFEMMLMREPCITGTCWHFWAKMTVAPR
jgi:hypothetical protein